ncbi:DUF3564 domain-containing protein [Paraburkholderia sp. CNPSo 3274]|uniref:DUF3564 family protein n=2 Tax=Paraburkholderia TaxID=1822464 RepID=A0A4V6PIM6_9BURK|nr:MULTISPECIES: DUF3564 family protein [Paraburkholderia]MCP3713725.1 DUF3564 domain-containing protein [Paraburkholderia sp. CNPSo 3274]MCP3728502.1 DUF3564 domain-containing protein [Paraburkholderia sp. CNPSo 3272]MCX5545328.1 DUF3564 family protein [Paraburkholderia sp. CNPSo 3076]TDG01849.1 DUF3564 family protein [Paraburkholderia guartelaensis]
MRITLHLGTFDRLDPNAYAILWLDNDTHKWSREGHAGLQFPDWGKLRVDARGTVVCDQHDARPLFILDGLAMEAQTGPFEGESGEALWCCTERESGSGVAGHWHVQCVDKDAVLAEHSVFAEDEV